MVNVSHQVTHLTGSDVLIGLFVVFFIEFTDQFLENIPHVEVCLRRQLGPGFRVSLNVRLVLEAVSTR